MDRDCGRACGNFTFILKTYCEMKGRRKTSFLCACCGCTQAKRTFLQGEKIKKSIDINVFFCYTNHILKGEKSKVGHRELWKKS